MITFMPCNVFERIWYSEFILVKSLGIEILNIGCTATATLNEIFPNFKLKCDFYWYLGKRNHCMIWTIGMRVNLPNSCTFIFELECLKQRKKFVNRVDILGEQVILAFFVYICTGMLETDQEYWVPYFLIRCGRVMADNIAYAKFRKSLLIW